MSPLLPSPVSLHALELPTLDTHSQKSLSECERRALTLDHRTGATVVLARSSIFVHGGFTIPLDLSEVNSVSIQQELILYFARECKSLDSFQSLSEWISKETFFLDLITCKWERVCIDEGMSSMAESPEQKPNAVMKKRVFHSMCFHDGRLYLFGGLVVSPQSDYELIASNELWSLDLETKTWLQLSSDPAITRRFNHSMHIVDGEDDDDDVRIYIVGGLNNLDRPVHIVDCYSITQNKWISSDELSSQSDGQEVVTNVSGQVTHILNHSNFSLMIRDEISEKPSLVLYTPNADGSQDLTCPLVSQALTPGSKGHRMPTFSGYSSIEMKKCKTPFNLQYPSGGYFGYNLIVSGFYPDIRPENFHCFIYNIPTGKWTEINTVSDDTASINHQLWQLFVWHSHHKVLFLGTKGEEKCSPSVQKFDTLLCIALPMINVFHKAMNYTNTRGKSATSSEHATFGHEGFEGYSRYSAPPLEITTISSVFPSHAMALGKDALELYGQHLSDFEIVTEDGDSVRVPTYLLRKRWGRYFDEVLSQGYVKAIREFENQNRHNEFTKLSSDASQNISTPTAQHFGSTSSKVPTCSSSQGSLEAFSNKSDQYQVSQPLFPLVTRKSSPLFFANKGTQVEKLDHSDTTSVDTKTVPTIHHSKSDSSALYSATSSGRSAKDQGENNRNDRNEPQTVVMSNRTTNSSGGMVFRLPFQENVSSNFPQTVPNSLNSDSARLEGFERYSGPGNRRKSSASASFLNSDGQKSRRASHPIVLNYDERIPLPGNAQLSHSPFCSRKTSVTSQNSSISFVSSTSDRMGNTAYRHMSQDSGTTNSTLNSVSSQIPPLQPMPSEPVPPAPQQPHFDLNNFSSSAKNSPFSSRRSSLYHDLLRPGLVASVSQSIVGSQAASSVENTPLYEPDPNSIHKRSMDRQLLEDNLIDVELEASLTQTPQKCSTDKAGRAEGDEGYRRISSVDECRESNVSTADSTMNMPGSAVSELEPLLLPRSLYMPWPTTTIKSFIEFFYTGQVNGKWLLSPVALNLLVMSKLYEIPLLYDLMSEVFYSILGKKEESLLTTAETMRHLFLSRLLSKCDESDDTIKQLLKDSTNYLELLSFEETLRTIDNGFFNTHLLRNMTRLGSTSSSESGERLNTREGKNSASLSVPILFADGPRGSESGAPNSSTQFNSTLPVSPTTRIKYPPATKETSPSKFPMTPEVNESEKIATQERSEMTERENKAEKLEQMKLSNMSQNESTDFSTQIIDIKPSETTNSEEIEQAGKKFRERDDDNSKLMEDSTSSSESGDLGAGFGLASTSKIEKKLRRRESEKSIDPLAKTGDSQGSSLKNITSYFKQGEKYLKTDASQRNVVTLTLDNMASANALPPVDYVIELIHETATLVHDVRLIVRCVSVIKLSKELKSLKQALDRELVALEDTLNRAETPSDTTPRSPGPAKFPGNSKSDGNSTLTPTNSVEKNLNVSVNLDRNLSKPGTPDSCARNSIAPEMSAKHAVSDLNLSDKSDAASVTTKGSRKSNRQPKVKKVNSHLAGSGLTGAAMFMSGSFTPVNKPKKEASSSNLGSMGGIPFFGKRK